MSFNTCLYVMLVVVVVMVVTPVLIDGFTSISQSPNDRFIMNPSLQKPRQQQFTNNHGGKTVLFQQSNHQQVEDIYAAVHRKEYELQRYKLQHSSTTDPIRMAMSYCQESLSPMKLAKALRRVYENKNYHDDNEEDETDDNNNDELDQQRDEQSKLQSEKQRTDRLKEYGLQEMNVRRGSFIVDIKRQSKLRNNQKRYCHYDDAGQVAAAMVRLGADVVFVNTDYTAYGGDIGELKSAVQAVKQVNKERKQQHQQSSKSSSSSTSNMIPPQAAVVMKDIVVDEIQLGIAKEAGADGILLMSCVLGPALEHFLYVATSIGLETIVECHTKNEIDYALQIMAPNILVNNYDRIHNVYHPNQAKQLAGLFPGSGGPIICLATGGIQTTEQMLQHLDIGYDGVVIGEACMGSPMAPTFIRAVREKNLLPAELAHWGLTTNPTSENIDESEGKKKIIMNANDPKAYQ